MVHIKANIIQRVLWLWGYIWRNFRIWIFGYNFESHRHHSNRIMTSGTYDEDGYIRNRSNSSTTPQAGNHGNSHSVESNCQRRVNLHRDYITGGDRDKRTHGNPSKIEQNEFTNVASKNENFVLAELNFRARRYFIACLSNTYVEEPVREVFPGQIGKQPKRHYRIQPGIGVTYTIGSRNYEQNLCLVNKLKNHRGLGNSTRDPRSF